MNRTAAYIALAYFAVISIAAAAAVCFDKTVSKIPGHRRIPEKMLFILSCAGGSIAMLTAMLTVRHKTRHKRFMIGLPVIIAFQLTALFCILRIYNYI